ncbi:hypothetical protein GA0070622_1222 [Micromonospora sediminicola]|uniref:Uncharacterized protein n=1 Tax=Micromonospora sediminicola TaxID=946078 RepID=A0A1A9B5R5_9ACTN|nr:hypothetical protein [Micromonospora sediminicola]SBT64252.1 hypothetical protein GA0070622_1222 [Micromonospora sediminicola]
MNLDPFQAAAMLIALAVVSFIVGLLVMAIAARARQLDEGDRAGAAFRELRDVAQRHVIPADAAVLLREAARIWDGWRPDGLHLEAYHRHHADKQLTETYVHRLLDALATGRPVDLSGCRVPADVRGRLRAMAAIAAATGTATPTPVGPGVVSVDTAGLVVHHPVRAGGRDG